MILEAPLRFIIAILIVTFTMASWGRVVPTYLISKTAYSKLSVQNRKAYINEVRSAFVRLEEANLKNIEVAGNLKDDVFSMFINRAFAEVEKCLIGGVEQLIIGGKCSTRNNAGDCRGDDEFKCGEIFGGVCIPRTPIKTISSRCKNDSASVDINLDKYNSFKTDAESKVAQFCQPGSERTPAACNTFKTQLAALSAKFGSGVIAEATDASGPAAPVTVSDVKVVAEPPPPPPRFYCRACTTSC